jgi:protein gp37
MRSRAQRKRKMHPWPKWKHACNVRQFQNCSDSKTIKKKPMNKTKIEWTDYTWNPVTGCHKVSAGCKLCYAEVLTKRFGKAWGTGDFRDVRTHPDRLNQPLEIMKKLKGKRVFVCDMSDLFHEAVSFEFIFSVFTRMASCRDTTFQVLTKRIKRAVEFYSWFDDRIHNLGYSAELLSPVFPVPNVWLGVSVENEKEKWRIDELLKCDAAVYFISGEPLIGALTLPTSFLQLPHGRAWVITGGESGHGAMPMHPDWARSLRDQCAAANVPFFFKQWGEYIPFEDAHDEENPGTVYCDAEPEKHSFDGLSLANTTHMHNVIFAKVGKSKSGNFLDGKQHLEFPTTKPALV